MLTKNPFYYNLLKKYVSLFGTLFNNITLVKRDMNTGIELERKKVPIQYGPKEKYFIRRESDPQQKRSLQSMLPRMAFLITSINYSQARKQGTLLRSGTPTGPSHVNAMYMGVPYDIGFELSILSRNIDDANQIVEQILPYFTPDYTPTVISIPELGISRDIPITLDSVSQEIDFEGGEDSTRAVLWTLNFTMQAHFFGPTSNTGIIRKVITNIYNDPSLQSGYITRLNMVSGNGVFQLDDLAFQGTTLASSNAAGQIISWSTESGKLILGGVQGQFKVGQVVRAESSNAAYTIHSFEESPLKLVQITITPDPIDAEPDDDYGYTTAIEETKY